MRHAKRHLIAVAAVLAAFTFLTPDDAQADPYVGLDLGVGVPIPDSFTDDPTTGPSVNLRFGYRLPIPVLYLAVEGLGSWQNFPEDEAPLRVLSGRGGLRVGFDALIAVKVFSHLGYTNLSGKGSDYTIQVDGLSWDAGLAIDFTLLPVVDFGVHGGYTTLMDDAGDLNWVEAGIHAELSF